MAVLVLSSGVTAKKDKKDTPAPTKAPSPKPSSSPTAAPSTLAPTTEPTITPTIEPSVTPTKEVVDDAEKDEPKEPEENPDDEPGEDPEVVPEEPEKVEIIGVELPILAADFIITDSDAATLDSEEMDTHLETQFSAFLETVLSTNTGSDTFDYAELEFDVIQSDFGRRRLDTGVSVKVEGTAYFGNEAPSEEEIQNSLRGYFSVWGIGDLQDFLQATGFPSAVVRAVSVDGDTVKPAVDAGKPTTGAQIQARETPDKSVSGGGIAGLVLASLVLIGAVVFIFIMRRRKVNPVFLRPSSETAKDAKTSSAPNTPDSSLGNKVNGSSDEESCLSGDGASQDMSLYTTNSSKPMPISQKQTSGGSSQGYDASRLDKVIALARENSTENSRVMYM